MIADYEVSAPLSSRRQLYSYILDANLPKGFPQLGPEFHWLFIRNDYRFLKILLDQGFEVVHRGKYLTIARRGLANLGRNSDFFDFARTRTLDKMSMSVTLGVCRVSIETNRSRASPTSIDQVFGLAIERPGALPGHIDVSGAEWTP